MKTATITVEELTEDNPTLCMSPLRVFRECHKCTHFKRATCGLMLPYNEIMKRIENMRCKPQIKDEVLKLIERKKELLRELSEINKALELEY